MQWLIGQKCGHSLWLHRLGWSWMLLGCNTGVLLDVDGTQTARNSPGGPDAQPAHLAALKGGHAEPEPV